ncbi:MAG: PEP-CTERM sorting domain-containing protein [Planctomycetota bacterium]
MKRTMITALTGLAACLVGHSQATANTFQLLTQLDAAALNIGVPGSVAAYGDTVYVANLFGGSISRITDPLGTPVNANTFGPALAGNGRVSLNTDGTTLVAASNNAGAADTVESYVFGTDVLNFSANPAAYGRSRFDGAAVDPNTGNIFVTGFGSGLPLVLDPASGADASDSPTSLFVGETGTGFRDVDFDNATGDIYLRAVNGVAVGGRNGADDFVKLDGTTAGVEAIAFGPTVADGFNSAINVEYVPAAMGAPAVAIFNRRNAADTFNDQVLVYEADSVNAIVAASFVNGDGTPFTTADAGSGIYDFSFDPVNELLYVSDFSTSQIHVFQYVPEPGTFVMAALAGVGLLARRR